MFVVCEEGIEEQYDYCVGNIIPKYIKQGVSFEEIAIIVQYNKHAKELGIICEDKKITAKNRLLEKRRLENILMKSKKIL